MRARTGPRFADGNRRFSAGNRLEIRPKSRKFAHPKNTKQFNTRYSERFEDRHNGPRQAEIDAMLKTIGVKSLDELIDKTIPPHIRLKEPLNTGAAMSEVEFLDFLGKKAARNQVYKNY